jgi:hypothetical protein
VSCVSIMRYICSRSARDEVVDVCKGDRFTGSEVSLCDACFAQRVINTSRAHLTESTAMTQLQHRKVQKNERENTHCTTDNPHLRKGLSIRLFIPDSILQQYNHGLCSTTTLIPNESCQAMWNQTFGDRRSDSFVREDYVLIRTLPTGFGERREDCEA